MKSKVNNRLMAYGLYDSEHSDLDSENVTNGSQGAVMEPHTSLWKMRISGIGSILVVHFSGQEKDQLQELFFHHMLQEDILHREVSWL